MTENNLNMRLAIALWVATKTHNNSQKIIGYSAIVLYNNAKSKRCPKWTLITRRVGDLTDIKNPVDED